MESHYDNETYYTLNNVVYWDNAVEQELLGVDNYMGEMGRLERGVDIADEILKGGRYERLYVYMEKGDGWLGTWRKAQS
jgi:hypothetical protein